MVIQSVALKIMFDLSNKELGNRRESIMKKMMPINSFT